MVSGSVFFLRFFVCFFVLIVMILLLDFVVGEFSVFVCVSWCF